MEIIAFDSHKRYTLARVGEMNGQLVKEKRINHCRGNITRFLEICEPGSPVAVETIGNWYWIIDEIEQTDMLPKLVHARKAKLMPGSLNKTDKLDACGLNLLQRTGRDAADRLDSAGRSARQARVAANSNGICLPADAFEEQNSFDSGQIWFI